MSRIEPPPPTRLIRWWPGVEIVLTALVAFAGDLLLVRNEQEAACLRLKLAP